MFDNVNEIRNEKTTDNEYIMGDDMHDRFYGM